MVASLQDVLGWVPITRAAEVIRDGIPDVFPEWLYTVGKDDKMSGNTAVFNRTYGTRKAARRITYGAPHHERGLQKVDAVSLKMISLGEKKTLDPYVLNLLRDLESFDHSNRAEKLVANEIRTLATLFKNTRKIAVASLLSLGKIYFDSSNNILPSSSGADTSLTVESQISATANVGTILDNNSAGIFGATGGGSWANASTDIPLQLLRLQEWASMAHGYEPKIALYGKNIRGYMVNNDNVLDYLAREGSMRSQVLNDTTLPNGLFGFEWIPAWKASYTKDDDTKVSLWPSNGITFLPSKEDMSQAWAMMEGSNFVPNTLDVQTDAMAALKGLQEVFGQYGYCRLTTDPMALHMLMGDCFLPAVKLPDVFYIADVVA